MSRELINRSPDLKQLVDEGFALEVRGGLLVVHDVPYVNDQKQVSYGKLVTDLTLAGDKTAAPGTHTASFCGSTPCNKNGEALSKIINSSGRRTLANDLNVDHLFSSKPQEGRYADYYTLVTTYVGLLSGHAEAIDPNASARKFKVVESRSDDSPFNYVDNASTRVGIYSITQRLAVGEIAIVGLGGTGSYVLDLIAKLPIRKISLYDGDYFLQHNAFRAPGAASVAALRERPYKVDYFAQAYSNMHKGITANREYIGAENVDLLSSADFVFLCLDGSTDRRPIIEALESFDLPFIDVGMGIEHGDKGLAGLTRITTSSPKKRNHIHDRELIPMDALPDEGVYSSNIQVADLNSFVASMAVIKMKRYFQFYEDYKGAHHTLIALDTNSIINEENTVEKK